ncbi:hypothetical protein TAL182_PE00089 (plasmid) [Rhizobium sp. TAL182]|nr:hypothetical protein TAL182_PE00089 [Rhizobium sp. TAL182]
MTLWGRGGELRESIEVFLKRRLRLCSSRRRTAYEMSPVPKASPWLISENVKTLAADGDLQAMQEPVIWRWSILSTPLQ